MAFKQMTAAEVSKKVINKTDLFILDVRNESDFNDWKIEGQNFEFLNILTLIYWMAWKKFSIKSRPIKKSW